VKFDVDFDLHKSHIMKSIVSKRKDNRQDMWVQVDNGTRNRSQLVAMVPKGVNKDQWDTFVDYRLSEKTKVNLLFII
jgi:hypothetical protein